jgi:hypothetical protein
MRRARSVRLALRAFLVPLTLLAPLALFASSCRQVAPLPAEALTDLASLDEFRASFNAQVHRPRLLVLLSPT